MATDYYVDVCDACLTAACWHGERMCYAAGGAGITIMRASDLDKIHKEPPGNYSREKLMKVIGIVEDVHA